MSSEEVKLLKTKSVRELEDHFSTYRKDQEKLTELINENAVETGIFFEVPTLYAADDYTSSKNLYAALKELTTVQASDERIWIYLFYTVFDDYRRERLHIQYGTRQPTDTELKSNTLFTGNNNDKIRAKFLNYLSRLWWAGYFYKDDDEALKTFTKQDLSARMTSYFSTTLTSLEAIRYGTMDAIKEFIEKVAASKTNLKTLMKKTDSIYRGEGVTTLLTVSNKYLNRSSSAVILDVFSRDEIHQRVYDYLMNYYQVESTRGFFHWRS